MSRIKQARETVKAAEARTLAAQTKAQVFWDAYLAASDEEKRLWAEECAARKALDAAYETEIAAAEATS